MRGSPLVLEHTKLPLQLKGILMGPGLCTILLPDTEECSFFSSAIKIEGKYMCVIYVCR